MNALDIALDGLQIGAPVAFENLTMFPLFGGDAGEPGYLTLDEALAQGLARVTEVSEQGSVPELRFINQADKPVLLLDGEELVGAKQNRIVNLTIMVAANSETVIPVSCVEAGRWHRHTEDFRAAERTHFARGRAEKAAHVNMSLCADGTRFSNQSAVWDAIARKAARMEARSATGAAAAMYENNTAKLDAFLAAMPAAEAQSGAAFAINGQLVGLDIFDSSLTLAKQLKKLVTSYALDAIDEQGGSSAEMADKACIGLLESVRKAKRSQFPAVGLGEDVRLDAPDLKGGALVIGEGLIHLCAFQVANEARHDGEGSRGAALSRASYRRRLH